MHVSVPQIDVQETTNEIEALQFQFREISNKIQGLYSGKEEFLTEKT